jgi:hypothetical protein
VLVDSAGLLLKAVAHAPNVQERAGATLVLAGITAAFPLLGLVCADQGYVNRVDAGLLDWAREHAGVELVIVPRNADVKGLQVLPPPVGGGTDFLLVRTVQTVGPRLSAQTRARRGDDQGSDDPVDGGPPGRRGDRSGSTP